MGRKKDEPLNLKVLFPKQQKTKDTIFRSQKLTLPMALAPLQKSEQLKPENRICEIQEQFKNDLLSTGLFVLEDDEKIHFHNPLVTKKKALKTVKNTEDLLEAVSYALADFFYREGQKIFEIGPAAELNEVIKKLISIKPNLLKAKIHKQRFVEIIQTLLRWEEKINTHIRENITPTQIDNVLIPALFKSFRQHTQQKELSDNALDNSLAIILKHFGLIEGGNLKTIQSRIKQNRMRKRNVVTNEPKK